jgi:transcriptional regulator with XRE-family HTH domain
MRLREIIGENVRLLRLEKGWTQQQLGDAAGIHRRYLALIEKGTQNVGVDHLEKLGAAFGVPISELVGRGEGDLGLIPRRIAKIEKAIEQVKKSTAVMESEFELLKSLSALNKKPSP